MIGDCIPTLGAIGHGHIEAVDYLLRAGADLDVMLGEYPYSPPLELAVHEDLIEIVNLLLRYGIDPDKHSPLARAAHWGKVNAARALLEGGVSVEGTGEP